MLSDVKYGYTLPAFFHNRETMGIIAWRDCGMLPTGAVTFLAYDIVTVS